MEHLGQLLERLSLPGVEAGPERAHDVSLGSDLQALAFELAGDLPAGHLHVWGGPTGAGKTSLLLSLLHGAASRGRTVVYATYDLHPTTLARRALAMLADVDAEQLEDRADARCALAAADAERAARVRATLASLPFFVLPARGFSVASLADRVVRAPRRAQVLVVDYVQAVVRETGSELGAALRDLSELATRLHLAVVGVFRAGPAAGTGLGRLVAADEPGFAAVRAIADRVGWIAPADGSGARRAEILQNRFGTRSSLPLHLDSESGRLVPPASSAFQLSDDAR